MKSINYSKGIPWAVKNLVMFRPAMSSLDLWQFVIQWSLIKIRRPENRKSKLLLQMSLPLSKGPMMLALNL